MSEIEALQVPGTLMERLQACIGMPVVVYLSGVHGMIGEGMPYMPPPGTGPGVPCPPGWTPGMGPGFGPGFGPGPGMGQPGGNWPAIPAPGTVEAKRELRYPCPPPAPGPRPPCPEPMPPMGDMRTAVVQGTLAFAGNDYLILNVARNAEMNRFHEVAIPYNAIGMILCGGVPV